MALASTFVKENGGLHLITKVPLLIIDMETEIISSQFYPVFMSSFITSVCQSDAKQDVIENEAKNKY